MNYTWNPTLVERSILGQIRNQQSRGQYNVLFGGQHFTDFSKFPVWGGVIYKGQPTHAAGAFQDEPASDAEASTATGIIDYYPASQDIKNLWRLRNRSQVSQWGTNFTYDGGWYGFPADAPLTPTLIALGAMQDQLTAIKTEEDAIMATADDLAAAVAMVNTAITTAVNLINSMKGGGTVPDATIEAAVTSLETAAKSLEAVAPPPVAV